MSLKPKETPPAPVQGEVVEEKPAAPAKEQTTVVAFSVVTEGKEHKAVAWRINEDGKVVAMRVLETDTFRPVAADAAQRAAIAAWNASVDPFASPPPEPPMKWGKP